MTLQEVAASVLQTPEGIPLRNNVRLNITRPLDFVFLDGALFERVLINLLENAAKYAGNPPAIEIHAQTSGGQLQIDVLDDGPGIPAGQEKAIFEKFTRGHKESSIPGIGLGLAICQAIVSVHEGTITSANRPPGRAIFTVRLPPPPPPHLTHLG